MAEFTEPKFWSECMVMEMSVEQALHIASHTQDSHVRDKLKDELHMHYVDYPCPTLRRALQQLNAMLGHKPYSKSPTAGKTGDIIPPLALPNIIFREENDDGKKIDMQRLWCWIYDILVQSLTAKYEWLSLLLFAKAHGLLKEDDTTKFCQQMLNWFNKTYTKQTCSYDQVSAYQQGFFRSPSFVYKQWVKSEAAVPVNWTPANEDQKKGRTNFKYIHEHCKNMEGDFNFGKIIAKDK